jgi:hypothetical protein
MSDEVDPEDIAAARDLIAQWLAERVEEVADEIVDGILRLNGGKIPKSQDELRRVFQEVIHSLRDRSVS